MKAILCPVCQGRQTVPPGFYSLIDTTSLAAEKCRSCNGLGYIVLSVSSISIWDSQGAESPNAETIATEMTNGETAVSGINVKANESADITDHPQEPFHVIRLKDVDSKIK